MNKITLVVIVSDEVVLLVQRTIRRTVEQCDTKRWALTVEDVEDIVMEEEK